MPDAAPAICPARGAGRRRRLHLVAGQIGDAGAFVRGRRRAARRSTSRRSGAVPDRGQEDDGPGDRRAARLAAPDVIVYPTGGGVGLIGIGRPSTSCRAGLDRPGPATAARRRTGAGVRPSSARTTRARRTANRGRTRQPLRSASLSRRRSATSSCCGRSRETGGTAIAVDDEELLAAQRQVAEREGA